MFLAKLVKYILNLFDNHVIYKDFSNKRPEKEIYKRLEDAERKLKKIEHSFIYHLVLKLSSINFPFKMKIRKLICICLYSPSTS